MEFLSSLNMNTGTLQCRMEVFMKTVCNLNMHMSRSISSEELIIQEPYFISSVLAAVTGDLSL